MRALQRALATLRRRRVDPFRISAIRIRCEAPAPNGRAAVCIRADGHDGRHRWVFL